MARLDDLRALRSDLIDRMAGCESDQTFGTLGQLLTNVVKQIEECEALSPDANRGTALDEFTRRRTEQQAAGSPRTAKRQQRG